MLLLIIKKVLALLLWFLKGSRESWEPIHTIIVCWSHLRLPLQQETRLFPRLYTVCVCNAFRYMINRCREEDFDVTKSKATICEYVSRQCWCGVGYAPYAVRAAVPRVYLRIAKPVPRCLLSSGDILSRVGPIYWACGKTAMPNIDKQFPQLLISREERQFTIMYMLCIAVAELTRVTVCSDRVCT